MEQLPTLQKSPSSLHQNSESPKFSPTTFCVATQLVNFELLNATVEREPPESKLNARIKISSKQDIEIWGKTPNALQIYTVARKHSFLRIGITKELFEHFCEIHETFNRIWHFVTCFGYKTTEGDLGQFPCKISKRYVDSSLELFECAYNFSYAAKNNRPEMTQGNSDYDLWSLRQVAVYQQTTPGTNNTTFLLIAPSELLQEKIARRLNIRCGQQAHHKPFALHHIILSVSHENWNNYLQDLGTDLKKQSTNLILAQVDNESNLGQPHELKVNFLDRQRLNLITDKTLNLMLIFESLLDTISRIKRHFLEVCRESQNAAGNCDECSVVLAEFEELELDTQLNLKKTNVLHMQAKEASKLATNLLEVENGIIARSNGEALTGLLTKAEEENIKMIVLAERSTRDAAAVRILTIITLIYLPVTVVASFFSSQLIQVSDGGQISVVSGAWWFAAVSIPLTAVTFLLWQLWLKRSLKSRDKKMRARSFPTEPKEPEPCTKKRTWLLNKSRRSALHNRMTRRSLDGGNFV